MKTFHRNEKSRRSPNNEKTLICPTVPQITKDVASKLQKVIFLRKPKTPKIVIKHFRLKISSKKAAE